MDIIDLVLITLELIALIAFTAYVIRYAKYFIGRGPCVPIICICGACGLPTAP